MLTFWRRRFFLASDTRKTTGFYSRLAILFKFNIQLSLLNFDRNDLRLSQIHQKQNYC